VERPPQPHLSLRQGREGGRKFSLFNHCTKRTFDAGKNLGVRNNLFTFFPPALSHVDGTTTSIPARSGTRTSPSRERQRGQLPAFSTSKGRRKKENGASERCFEESWRCIDSYLFFFWLPWEGLFLGRASSSQPASSPPPLASSPFSALLTIISAVEEEEERGFFRRQEGGKGVQKLALISPKESGEAFSLGMKGMRHVLASRRFELEGKRNLQSTKTAENS